jgi:hypothetical protein
LNTPPTTAAQIVEPIVDPMKNANAEPYDMLLASISAPLVAGNNILSFPRIIDILYHKFYNSAICMLYKGVNHLL